MSSLHVTPKHSALTQWCRDLIQMLSYEDILSITVYLPPMLFMAGPATILANNSWITLLLNAIVGFTFSWVLHRMGHRFLRALPNEPEVVYLSTSVRLPMKLTLIQFVWMMEFIVAAAIFSAVVGKRLFLVEGGPAVLSSVIFFAVCLGLYFLPVYLRRLWIERHYSSLSLSRPTAEVVNKSFPGIPFR